MRTNYTATVQFAFAGAASEGARQAGNAVCPPIMRAILERCTAALDATQVEEEIA